MQPRNTFSPSFWIKKILKHIEYLRLKFIQITKSLERDDGELPLYKDKAKMTE